MKATLETSAINDVDEMSLLRLIRLTNKRNDSMSKFSSLKSKGKGSYKLNKQAKIWQLRNETFVI